MTRKSLITKLKLKGQAINSVINYEIYVMALNNYSLILTDLEVHSSNLSESVESVHLGRTSLGVNFPVDKGQLLCYTVQV